MLLALRHRIGHGVERLAHAVYLLGPRIRHAVAVVTLGNLQGGGLQSGQRRHHTAGGAPGHHRSERNTQQRCGANPQGHALKQRLGRHQLLFDPLALTLQQGARLTQHRVQGRVHLVVEGPRGGGQVVGFNLVHRGNKRLGIGGAGLHQATQGGFLFDILQPFGQRFDDAVQRAVARIHIGVFLDAVFARGMHQAHQGAAHTLGLQRQGLHPQQALHVTRGKALGEVRHQAQLPARLQ